MPFCHAVLVHVSLPSPLAPPVIMLLLGWPTRSRSQERKNFTAGVETIAHSAALSICSILISGGCGGRGPPGWFRTSPSHRSVNSHSKMLSLPDLTPNPGLWRDIFTEMFDRFRPSFLMTFSIFRNPMRKRNR